jgi:hypothetical protein
MLLSPTQKVRQVLHAPPRRRSARPFDIAIEAAYAKWPCLGQGRHRVTFALNDEWVIKIPLHWDGEVANVSEYEQYHDGTTRSVPHLAWCMVEEFHGVVVLLMERVKPIDVPWEEIQTVPDLAWVADVDCEQVGYTLTGALVAYDYSWN